MKSSQFSSPKQASSGSPKTPVKSSQKNYKKLSSTPNNSPKSLSKNRQVNYQSNSPIVKNSPKSPSKKSQVNSQVRSPTMKSSPNAEKIRELRLLQKNAIDNLDFAEAEIIDKQISGLKSGTLNSQLSIIKVKFDKSIKSIISGYKTTLIDLSTEKDSNINRFRCQINDSFENLKNKQMKEMVDLEKIYANDRLKETQRSSPQYESIILQAKSAGVLHDFKSALELQNSALQVSQSILEKRLSQIDKDYEVKNEALLQKHTKEVILLVKRLEDGLKRIDDQYKIALSKEKSLFDLHLLNEYKKTSKEIQLQTSDISTYLQEIEQILYQILSDEEIEIPKLLCETVKNSSKLPMNILSNSPK